MQIHQISTTETKFHENTLTVTTHDFNFEESKNYLPYLFHFDNSQALYFLTIFGRYLRNNTTSALKVPVIGSFYISIGVPGDFSTLTSIEITDIVNTTNYNNNYVFATEKDATNFIRNVKLFIEKNYKGPNFIFNTDLHKI